MTRTMSTVILMAVLMTTATIVTSTDLIGDAYALKAKGVGTAKYGSSTNICGVQLCSDYPGGKSAWESEQGKVAYVPQNTSPQKSTKNQMMMQGHDYKAITGTIQSVQDPGVGHEQHQIAIILPPSDVMYKGQLTYSASEPIQLVALHGPLGPGEDKGQPTWSPDGETKFALTFIDPKTNMGTWDFTGNAIAVHTKKTEPFTVSYSAFYMEKQPSSTVKTETIQSVQDPGVGHEQHQLAIILPPSEKTYHGFVTYSASEPIQLVALHGPLGPGEDKGQPTWSPDGETKFALTFIDPKTNMGTWDFTGNAIAVHTKNPTKFTVSYSVAAGEY